MDADQTVFYLTPENYCALEIIRHPDNSNRTCRSPRDPKTLCLRIGLDQESKSPPILVSFGRRDHNDVILNNYFHKTDQCYFDFNKETGELLLHDVSEDSDTQLTEIIKVITNEDEDEDEEEKEKLGDPQISKIRRQCVVLLRPDLCRQRVERQWLFQIRGADFRLIPGRTHGRSEAPLIKERLAFAGKTNNNGTIERTLQQLGTLDLQPKGLLARKFHNTWFQTPPKPEKDKVIRITKLKPLGRGGQGEVHEVVDMCTGTHYACKIVDGFKIGQEIQIFMPVYEGNLHDLLEQPENREQEKVRTITSKMLYQMLEALNFVHTHDPPIIHRDVKPPNILHRGGNFFLTDFGIAKAVDSSNTIVRTGWYMAPEVRENRQQLPKVDI
ncbi:IPL1-Ser/thr protein kinase [Fusarium austroafricanum]|uniref:IPL1-Ser/thr protein kinase n=1 Tax=Fusarium austroafricanum TaxID=2364996 RepID=A0A8H4JNY7_9HYPO|nr:IPL1-Ser/thr protein kinase [Fusarium austroafricanum]